jgi:hypothetical protein
MFGFHKLFPMIVKMVTLCNLDNILFLNNKKFYIL